MRSLNVLPLRWRPHHIKGNGFFGVAANGFEVCYVYQPVDMRIVRGKDPWDVHCFIGTKERPLHGNGRFGKFRTARSAKLAAQKWWRDQVLALCGKANRGGKT